MKHENLSISLNVSKKPNINKDEIIITPLQNRKLLEAANILPRYGVLKLHDEKLVYLDIDNRFINELCPLIEHEQAEKPDYFSIGIGAHISIIYPNEKLNPDCEYNKIIQFRVENLFRAETNQAIYFVLTVNSPDLIKIRAINNLGEKLNLNGLIIDMHITIGKICKEA